jgi:hypothetical protein
MWRGGIRENAWHESGESSCTVVDRRPHGEGDTSAILLDFDSRAANSGRMAKIDPHSPPTTPPATTASPPSRKPLSPAAERALAEAAARRAARDKLAPSHSGEVRGPAGPDPVRYGDWEVKGIASDF